MKKYIVTSSVVLMAIISTGCSSKQTQPAQVQISPAPTYNSRVAIYKELPSWVIEGKNPYVAVGSAPFREQDYSMQRDEAIIVAKAQLIESLEQKIDSLKKLHRGIGIDNKKNVKLELTTEQISSKLIGGTLISNTFVASNGEMFVEVVLGPKFALSEGEKMFISNELKADDAFKELENKAKIFEDWKK